MSSKSEPELEPVPSTPEEQVLFEFKLQGNYPRVADILPHEPLSRYAPGGFHPVTLGDKFRNGRYIIRHKLGFGGYSTVWLARDFQEKQWVSLKIKQAKISKDQLEEDPDIKSFNLLEHHYTISSSKESRRFVRILDYFQHTGPNGTHTCIVTELLGPTISHLLKVYNDIEVQETLRPDTILRASRQLLEALDFVHSAGLTHGDISPSNVAFTCNRALQEDENFWEVLGGDPITADYKQGKPRSSHLPSQLVGVAIWAVWYDGPEEDLRLIGWGDCFPISEKRSSLAQPRNLRSPETFFVGTFDHRHDLWRAGCAIFTLFFQRSCFGSCISDAEYLHSLVLAMGELPDKWQKKGQEIISSSKEPLDSIARPLDEIFEPRREAIISKSENSENYEDDFAEDDYQGLKTLLDVMKGLMQHDPDERISAREAAARIKWVDHWQRQKGLEE